ncbi:MAG: hypothetical protein ABWY77_07480 [Acidimicrobiia bacterium]
MATPAPQVTSRRIQHPWRVAIVAIALLAVLNLGVVLLRSSDSSVPGTASLPSSIQSVSPEPGELTSRIDDVTVDLNDAYTGRLVINGVDIPDDQTSGVHDLGIITFRPGPKQDITAFRAGENDVVVKYWPQGKDEPAKPFVYSWRFQAAA